MSLTATRLLPAFLLVLTLLSSSALADTAPNRPIVGHRAVPKSTADRLALYSPRLRRSTASYLRLRLLELREADLERARAAIERRLSIDELISQSTSRTLHEP